MKQGHIHASNFATLKRHTDDNFLFVTGFAKTHHLRTQWQNAFHLQSVAQSIT